MGSPACTFRPLADRSGLRSGDIELEQVLGHKGQRYVVIALGEITETPQVQAGYLPGEAGKWRCSWLRELTPSLA